MVYKVILTRFYIRWSRKVYSKVFTSLLNIIPSPRQSNNIRMKFYINIPLEERNGRGVPARYFLSAGGSSRAGSQVMNNGCMSGFLPLLLTVSTIPAILSSSSGQISGHRVNPKYICRQLIYSVEIWIPECVFQRKYLELLACQSDRLDCMDLQLVELPLTCSPLQRLLSTQSPIRST